MNLCIHQFKEKSYTNKLGNPYAMPLTDVGIRNARPRNRDYYLTDADGLCLCVTSAGRKIWRFRRLYDGRQVLRTLGRYPAIPLAEARQLCEQMNISFDRDIDPHEEARQQQEARDNTFEIIAREWHTSRQDQWCEAHAHKILQRLEANIFPFSGQLPITDVAPRCFFAPFEPWKRKATLT